MSHRQFLSIASVMALLTLPAFGQIATSNEKGATGAYSSDVDSSYTSEGRFGPHTALDDLRAGVDRDREQIERVRQQQLEQTEPPSPLIEPFLASVKSEEEEGGEADSADAPG